MCSGAATGARGHVHTLPRSDPVVYDSRKFEEKVTPAKLLFLVEKYSTEDRTGLLITTWCYVWSSELQLILNKQYTYSRLTWPYRL
jgi:hypothetical protein